MNELGFLYNYGIATGIFITMFIAFLLVTIYQLLTNKSKHVATLFSYGALSVLCFLLFDLYATSIESPELKTYLPSWLLIVGSVTVPIGLFLNFHLYLQSLPINDASIFTTWSHYKRRYPIIIAYFVVCFIFSIFVENSFDAVLLASVLIIFNHVILFPLSYQTLKTVPYSKVYLQILAIFLMCFVTFIGLILTDTYQALSLRLKTSFHIVIGIIFCIYNFVLCQYILKSTLDYEEISGFNTNGLYKDIYSALDNNEFFLEYQPQIDLKTEKVKGLEALIRWEHPKNGLIPPLKFIPFAEKSLLIDDICKWVINQVIADIKIMRDSGIDVPVAINFSVNNLHPKMIRYLQHSLEHNHLPVSAILVEITESVFLDITESIQESLDLLESIGIGISLDDFGAGYSSLRHVSELGLAEIKIDRSLIDVILNNKQRTIISAILNMCQSLGIKVVAEGVNDMQTINTLLEIDCDFGQGYNICRPKRIEVVLDWIKNAKFSLQP